MTLADRDPQDLADLVLEAVDGRADAQVRVTRLTHGLTRFANSRIHQHVGERTSTVELRCSHDGRVASASTSRITRDGVQQLVERTLDHMAASPVDPDLPEPSPPHEVTPRSHVAESTAEASPDHRADVVADFVAADPETDAAGYVETRHTEAVYANSRGHRAADAATLAVVDGIHRQGTAAGAAHQGSRALADLDGRVAGADAADVARRSVDAADLDPGVMPVVLGPEALATIAIFLGLYGFNARAVEEGRSFVRLHEQQFDPDFSLRDDVTEPRATGLGFDAEGTAKGRLDLVRDGMPVALAHDRRTAAAAGTTSTGHHIPGSETMGPIPTDLVVGRGGTPASELVGSIDRGLYVAAFNYCRVLDPRSLAVTGLTRNGTFLIEDGEIGPPVQNLRFTQSFVEALAPGQVRAVGDDDRYASCEFGAGMVIAPSIALDRWNFTGGASG